MGISVIGLCISGINYATGGVIQGVAIGGSISISFNNNYYYNSNNHGNTPNSIESDVNSPSFQSDYVTSIEVEYGLTQYYSTQIAKKSMNSDNIWFQLGENTGDESRIDEIRAKYQDQIDKHNRTKAELDIAHNIFGTVRDFGFMVGAVCLGTAAIMAFWPAAVAGGTIAMADGNPTRT